MRVQADWLQARSSRAVFSLLGDAGWQVYAVGGAVRNTLLALPVNDVDFATDAPPETVLDLAKRADMTAIPTGIDHGTVTIVTHGQSHEITTFRKDIRTDGRHAHVVFAASLTEDAHRRDFTMNALYLDQDGRIFDPLHGIDDLHARRLRFIDNPEARIKEDYLRILRFFRFYAQFGDPSGGIDTEALAAVAQNADGLALLSKERIGAEMRKLLDAPNPAPSIASMTGSGVLHRVLPGADGSGLAPLVHLEETADLRGDWRVRLALMGGEDLAGNLRLSRAEARRIDQLRGLVASPALIAELAYRHGEEVALGVALLRAAYAGQPLEQELKQRISAAAQQTFPVRAADLAELPPGPKLGARLRQIEQRWIDSGFALNKEELLQ